MAKKKAKDVAARIQETSNRTGAKYLKGSGESILGDPFDDDREIWEQQEHESDKDYGLFLKFMKAPVDRRTHREFAEDNNVSIKLVQRKSSTKKWRVRREAASKLQRQISQEKLIEMFREGAENVHKEFAEVNQLILNALKVGVDLTKIKSHLSRAYAIGELTRVRDKVMEQAVKMLGGKNIDDTTGEISTEDGNITITFRTKSED